MFGDAELARGDAGAAARLVAVEVRLERDAVLA
jgi:hypothetical protein